MCTARFFSTITVLLISILAIAGNGNSCKAQSVSAVQNISFGSLNRSTTVSVNYSSGSAAQFQVVGWAFKKIRLTISVTNLSRSSSTLPISVSTSDCAYSTNGGSNWTSFSTGTLYQDTYLPWTNFLTGTILVRVGGSVTSASTQQRGSYSGSITLTASYL